MAAYLRAQLWAIHNDKTKKLSASASLLACPQQAIHRLISQSTLMPSKKLDLEDLPEG